MADNFVIRLATLADAAAIGSIHVTSWQEAYRGILPQPHLDSMDIHARQQFWKELLKKGGVVQVAECGGIVTGFAIGGQFRGEPSFIKHELYALYVLAAFHRRGIGEALFTATRQKHAPFGVWVLADNPACRFYEAMGGCVADEKWDDIGGTSFKELLYLYE